MIPTTLELFADDPVGHCVAGADWIHWCADRRLFGVVLWGRPGLESITALVRSLALELGPRIEPHQSLVDASRLDSVDVEAFDLLGAYVRRNHPALARQVTRLALVRPTGMAGAVVAGFFEVLDPPYPVARFGTARDALVWLERGADADLLPALDVVRESLTSVPSLLGALRVLIADDLRDVDVRKAARALGVSERSLQRRLHELGTSFQDELCAARLRDAERRMLDSDAPLTRIALDVGFTSAQHFSTQFRRLRHETPTQWRAGRRAAR